MKKSKYDEARRDALEKILKDKVARAWLWMTIESLRPLAPALRSDFEQGKQAVGLVLIQELIEVDPQWIAAMEEEIKPMRKGNHSAGYTDSDDD
jgi:hypothetical protein